MTSSLQAFPLQQLEVLQTNLCKATFCIPGRKTAATHGMSHFFVWSSSSANPFASAHAGLADVLLPTALLLSLSLLHGRGLSHLCCWRIPGEFSLAHPVCHM